VGARGTFRCELRNPRTTSNSMILVPLRTRSSRTDLPPALRELRVRGTGHIVGGPDRAYVMDDDSSARPRRVDSRCRCRLAGTAGAVAYGVPGLGRGPGGRNRGFVGPLRYCGIIRDDRGRAGGLTVI